ncbi:hypothetical protein PTE30175_05204 [Pandoraea terrae]|uniref:NrS-1 polymerase-like helicase domain-containing protein n=1 Tax=Pandoraea terrae TaxID=1537710 RepID=A0A5E4ZAG2_9BURK|nr:primase-helicase family protein [Pandoraea terrae]VVE58229.1 hypothetical protein PTE30175_05204 [Pandoraea terrae]
MQHNSEATSTDNNVHHSVHTTGEELHASPRMPPFTDAGYSAEFTAIQESSAQAVRGINDTNAQKEIDEHKAHKKLKQEQRAAQADLDALTKRNVSRAPWAQDWYFVSGIDRFIKLGELNTYSMTGFNTVFAQEIDLGAKGNPYTFVRDTVGFKEAHGMAYAAGYGPVYEFDGMTLINTYRESRVPKATTEYTPEGAASVSTVRAHLRNLFESERDAAMVESWIALNVRNPGKLIGVALLVKGAEGDGKSVIFHEMMREIMGKENVAEVSQIELHEKFNSWGIGKAVRVLEEIKVAGKNRYDVLNAVKPLITNPTVRTVAKGGNGVSSPNTTNYVGLTNHEDALPISNVDRRWWVVFTPYAHRSELAAKVGDLRTYFEKLRAAIYGHGDALRKYFLECGIHPEVYHGMQAPETEGRRRMMATDTSAIGGDYLDGYLADGGRVGISSEVVAVSALTEQLESDMGRSEMPQSRQVARLLVSRGYIKCEGTFMWNYKTVRVYVKDKALVPLDTKEIRTKVRELLDATNVPQIVAKQPF